MTHGPMTHGQDFDAGPVRRLRIQADPESVEKGLVTLVLTLVELLRQLMERQALRRVDQGSLSGDQIETWPGSPSSATSPRRRGRRRPSWSAAWTRPG
jgi:Gas vesicle protein K